MQSLFGKLRFFSRLRVDNLIIVDTKTISCFESKFQENLVNQAPRFNYHLYSSSAFFLDKNIGSKTSSPNCSISDGIGLNSCLNQPSSMVFALPTRNFTNVGSASEEASHPCDVPQRIKFKRLDKTARHIMQIVDKEAVEEVKSNRDIPDVRPGCIVQLKVEVPENKRRTSIIKGIVIARRNAGLNTTFRIRRLVAGVGIESLYHLYSPNIKEIKVLDKKKVRRAKLYYLRDKMNALKKQ
ncbi:large ribosomal subunit protein bL19c-like isoform X2 [Primulina tabacum]|uniref:large ribosomal subunit protein bL19c-like isoform X2 n=1 Tax=Primulina tabacum TaxID=48773 RepID=UPI003F59A6A0